jgi:queuosine precursor transporter
MQPVEPTAPAPAPAAMPPAPPRPAAATVSRLAIAAVGAYVGAQVIADITSVKIGSTFDRAVDMGTFVYPITFTLRDVVHKALGKRAARTLIVTAAFVNLFMALYLQWVARVPSDESYPLGDEFSAVLGPLWRIVVASIVAEVVSELLDTEVYHWFVRRVASRYQWARVAVSNAVSVPVDNAIFAVAAFLRVAAAAHRPRPHVALGRRVGRVRGQHHRQGPGVRRQPAAHLHVARPRLARRPRRRLTWGRRPTALSRPGRG